MPRPSLKNERREQILDAYELCLIRFGVEGTTLDSVAKECGLARPLIRHNVGNREALLDLMLERFTARTNEDMKALKDALPKKNALLTLIDWMFDPQESDPHTVLLSNALTSAAQDNADIAEIMRDWTRKFIILIEGIVRQDFPKAEEQAVTAVSAGIIATYFTAESVTPIGSMDDLRSSCRNAALRLVHSL